ncbi:hypothetical protein ACFV24_32985 [Nocardia fluminea]|uniref:hypothetical protein n=1 Tax=Nocardia fluminea TaxID=134984 RepID=UPI00366D2F3F
MFGKLKASRSPVDLTDEAPADVREEPESHTLEASGFGLQGKFSSSGNPVVGKAMALLILIGVADGTGFLIAELAERYRLHPGVAIPLVIGTGVAIVVTGILVILAGDPAADSPPRLAALQSGDQRKSLWWPFASRKARLSPGEGTRNA